MVTIDDNDSTVDEDESAASGAWDDVDEKEKEEEEGGPGERCLGVTRCGEVGVWNTAEDFRRM
jgi:hypothetical protein